MFYKNKYIIFTRVEGSHYKIYTKIYMEIVSHCSSFRKVVVDGKLLQHCNQSIVNEFVLVLLTIQIVKNKHSYYISIFLTALVTSCGFCIRIVIIVWKTSAICSALNLLILTTRAQKVPERPTPSLQKQNNSVFENNKSKFTFIQLILNTITHLQ